MTKASALVAKLGEQASPRPWASVNPHMKLPDGDELFWVNSADGKMGILETISEPNAAYTALAVNSIGLVLKALEKRMTPAGHLRLSHDHTECKEVAEALDTVAAAAKKALA